MNRHPRGCVDPRERAAATSASRLDQHLDRCLACLLEARILAENRRLAVAPDGVTARRQRARLRRVRVEKEGG